MKQEYLQKIKDLQKITLTKVCKDTKVDKSNLISGKASLESTKKVHDKMIEEIKKIIER